MNYFVGENLGKKLTGIEKSQINRVQLFKKADLPATCIYTEFNTRLHENAAKYGIEGSCFSLYDYFQESIAYEKTEKKGWIYHWVNDCSYEIKYVLNSYDIRVYDKKGLFIMYAHFNDTTYTNLVYLNYFDLNGKKIKREFYDSRGFLSRINILRPDQSVNTETYLDIEGRIKIEKFYHLSKDNRNELTKILLKNHRGRDYFFNNENQLRTFFFDECFSEEDVIFCDRNRTLAEALSNTEKNLQICAILHSTHATQQEDVLNSPLKQVYRYVLNNPSQFKKIIVSTKQQKEDLLERFPNKMPEIVVIPVGFTKAREVNIEEKQKNKIIGVARYSPEKQILHQIDAIGNLVSEFPDIELHLFGYGREETAMREKITQLNLENHVFIRGFSVDLFAEYASSSLSLLTSLIEGFSLALLEAQEGHVPLISYDIRYGPGELIEDGWNGFLVEPNNQEMLTEKIRVFLSNPELQLEMMNASKENAEKYHEHLLIQKWQDLITTF